MRINKPGAHRLCRAVIRSIVTWRALDAALQSGGVEQKARGRFANAVESWLQAEGKPFLVLPEYRRSRHLIDLAVVDHRSVTREHLVVKSLFEVKFNYASQCNAEDGGEIRRRVVYAVAQARNYETTVQADSAFVLYLIAAPTTKNRPPLGECDTGWKYFRESTEPYMTDATRALRGSDLHEVLGEYSIRDATRALYTCLIAA